MNTVVLVLLSKMKKHIHFMPSFSSACGNPKNHCREVSVLVKVNRIMSTLNSRHHRITNNKEPLATLLRLFDLPDSQETNIRM